MGVKPEIHIKASAFWARFVLLLDDLGLINANDWTDANGDATQIGMSALTRWVNHRTESLQCVGANFQILGSAAECDVAEVQSALAERRIDQSAMHAVFALSDTEIRIFLLEEKISRLESLHPGLGQAALAEISRAGWRSLPVFAPMEMLYQATMLYWQGENDESSLIEEMRLQGMTDAEIADEDIITRQYLQGDMPAFVLEPKEVGATALRAYRTANDAWAREVVAAIESLRRIRKTGLEFFPATGMDAEILSAGCVLRWNQSDHVVRVFDDLHNYWYQGDGYTDLFGVECVELTANSLRKFFKHMDRGFAFVRALDHLIALVTDPEE